MRRIDSLEELKDIELNIMKHIHEFCNRNNIEYTLAYGTLLGAIRHNGFIPWDDDIDIFMTRKNYERFRSRFGTYGLKNQLYIASYDTIPVYPRDMIKVCDSRTCLVEKEFEGQDSIGVFVDIWPLDGTPDNEPLRRLHCARMSMRRIAFEQGTLTTDAIKKRFPKFKQLVALSLHFYIKRIVGVQKYLKKNIKLAKRYSVEDSEILECYSAPTKLNHFRKNSLLKIELHQFETETFCVPSEWDVVLKNRYGNYMELPPIKDQIPRHISDIYWVDEEV